MKIIPGKLYKVVSPILTVKYLYAKRFKRIKENEIIMCVQVNQEYNSSRTNICFMYKTKIYSAKFYIEDIFLYLERK